MPPDSRHSSLPPVDLLVIGAQKAGTTTLWSVLCQQPWFRPAQFKELHHFSRPGVRSDEAYRALFPVAARPGQLRGEATPDYLASYEAPSRIEAHNPDTRMIVLLRDPFDRARSAFQHAQRLGSIGQDEALADVYFEEARRRVTGQRWARIRWDGMYAQHILRYRSAFPAEQLHVEFFEDFIARPAEVLERIWQFVGVESLGLDGIPHANRGRSSRMPRASNALQWSRRAMMLKGRPRAARTLMRVDRALARPQTPTPVKP
jgi:hypothetical protein